MTTETLLVHCTCPDSESANRLARQMVEPGLAACVNVIPHLTSVYAWEGNIHEDTEVLLLIKTTAKRYHQLERAILESHPYELPEIIAVPIERGLPGYLDWVDQSTKQ